MLFVGLSIYLRKLYIILMKGTLLIFHIPTGKIVYQFPNEFFVKVILVARFLVYVNNPRIKVQAY